ncbi:MAG: hypothetical protein AAF740_04235 [Bacteroidota bacterium]
MKKLNIKINWRYITGEFLIVVVGIVTAFQLNSCKEDRKNAELLSEYLEDLRVGLNTDSIFYGNSAVFFDQVVDQIDSAQYFIQNDSLSLPKAGQRALRGFSSWYRLYISNAAFEDLNNAGRLNLIKDKELRYELISYYQYIDFLRSLEDSYTKSLGRMQENLLERLELSNKEIPLEIKPADVPLILNYLNQKRTYVRSYLSHRKTCHEISISIRKMILERPAAS